QQLRALAAEYRLALRVIDEQQVATLEAHPVEGALGPHGMKKALQRMLKHCPDVLIQSLPGHSGA
ncbi:hypothetical protein AADU03_005432, partial [Escherichia coli]